MSARAAVKEAWVSPQPRSGGLRVAVVYPNDYRVGMSNLGYQTVLGAFLQDPRFDARRAFWNGRALMFPDGGRSLDEFEAVALSVSYQPDMVHLPRLLEAGRARPSRSGKGPLVIGGGVALTINPETSANLFDLIVIGDAEPVLPELLDRMSASGGRLSFLESMSDLPGVYVPSRYTHDPDAGSPFLLPAPDAGAPAQIRAAVMPALSASPARPAVVSSDSEFGNLYLLEVSRGCPAGCFFCAAGSICGPVRFLPMESFTEEAERGLCYRDSIGLVGTAVSYHPGLAEMARYLLDRGGRFSPSSVRAEKVTPELAGLLVEARHRTVSLAPEAGTEGLRRAVGKGMTDADFIRRADILLEAGIMNLKLYFMVGLPGETDADISGIADLVKNVREKMLVRGRPRGRIGTVTLSVNPFVPKPRTALERVPMAAEQALKERLAQIRSQLGPVPNVRVQTGSVRGAYLDALLSLGDHSVAAVLDKLPAGGVSLNRLTKLLPAAERILFGRESGDLPWRFIK